MTAVQPRSPSVSLLARAPPPELARCSLGGVSTAGVQILTLRGTELASAEAFYRSLGRDPTIGPDETVLLARCGESGIGAVRLVCEQGSLVLRTMQVHPDWQRRGIGTALLQSLVELVDERECFCLPWDHLVGFYAASGFAQVEPAVLPSFLQERLRHSQAAGQPIVGMRRTGRNATGSSVTPGQSDEGAQEGR